MSQVFTLPDVGEGLTEADIVAWKVSEGDTVSVNQVLVEIETAKSVVELPSPFEGTVQEILVAEGDTVEVGTPIISVSSADDAPAGATDPGYTGSAPEDGLADAPAPDTAASTGEDATSGSGRSMDSAQGKALVGSGPKADPVRRRRRTRVGMRTDAEAPQGLSASTSRADAAAGPADERKHGWADRLSRTGLGSAAVDLAEKAGKIRDRGESWLKSRDEGAEQGPASASIPRRPNLAKPPVRKAAKEMGIDLADVQATGDGGQVTKRDLLAYAAHLREVEDGPDTFWTHTGQPANAREERIRVKGVRKATAQNMVKSAFSAPHVSIFVEVDASRTMEFVKRLKQSPHFEGVKVTPLLILAKAVIWAAARNPQVNATWTDTEIIIKRYMNLGIAAATPRGLLVPNIKDAQDLSLRELAIALHELTQTARAGRTQPGDMQGGTLSITNIGALGIDTGTPIINPGEAAIVAFGTIKQKPWVVDGDVIPRWITTLGGSFDHRVVDGDLSARFMADVARILEEPALLLD
ncbi:dihydrolipoamide acetyltransferase family protein [Kocuria sp. CPCC 205261]|uniref:dihydrolipoamide acetyltransferase family protein n=1 Tax=Kocuria sp. CPCC 205261 TaxID=3073554 RepID=UPI0034D50176